jgi:prepilin-type processing-associated H-X9-DG protein
MKLQYSSSRWAFTLIESLVAGAVFVLILSTVLAGTGRNVDKSRLLNCVNNLEQMGVAERMWEREPNRKQPANAPTELPPDLLATGNIVGFFQGLSNEMVTPKILWCPADAGRHGPNDLASLSRSNISYFMSLNVPKSHPRAIIFGDANIVLEGRRVPAGIFTPLTNSITWTKDRHGGSGNVLIADGSVQGVIQNSAALDLGTNSVAVP